MAKNQISCWDIRDESQNSKYLSSLIFLVLFAIRKQNKTSE